MDEIGYLTSLIPVHRGFTWTLSECFYGNEKDKKPVVELVNAVNKYEGLMENALKIEGLIKARSVHASGIYIFNDKYTEINAMMRASSGQPITQFDMGDSDRQGALKVDALTVQAIDRIRNAFDSLIEFGYIKDLNGLRETYDESIHPDVLEYNDSEMWDKVAENKIPDLFQFDTAVGLQCAKKTKPRTVVELSNANSIMRLMAEDGNEQPMDKFVRHKENIQEWYSEMNKYNISKKEREIISKHLAPAYGVTSSQEELMLIMMDENISNFTVQEANFARRIIGKKLMDKIPEVQYLFFRKGKECGSTANLLNYIWDTQIVPQLGYSFSNLHSTGYSLIALQEMNIATKYPDIIWATACLSVSANASDEEEFVEDDTQKKNKTTKYGKVAASIGKMKSHGITVQLPSINKSKLEFFPDLETNKILYGLKGIVGINDDIARIIIDNRPYSSFEDFYDRLYKNALVGFDEDGGEIRGSLIQKSHMLALIKAGAFNEFNSPVNIMRLFIKGEIDIKVSLNMQNFKSILRLGLLNTPELDIYKQLYHFKDYISKNILRTIDKPKDKILGMDEYATNFYYRYFKGESVVRSDKYVEISEKKFKKEYDELFKPFKELLSNSDFVRKYNESQFLELWYQLADGSMQKWEMDSVSFYSDKHELDDVDMKYYGINNFFDMSIKPNIIGYNKFKGRETPKYETTTIVGTVLDKDKNKHTVTILTPTGVVTCKMYAGSFAHYDKTISKFNNGKKETIEKSWFTRGNLLMVRGFRREDQFVLRTYANQGMKKEHTISLIQEVREDGSLVLQSDRARV